MAKTYGLTIYDVYYYGGGVDKCRLPEPHDGIAYACNTRGEYVIPVAGVWIEVDRDEALERASRPGRPLIGAERRERYQVRLEPKLAEWLDALGNGNRSAGIERAAKAAGYKP